MSKSDYYTPRILLRSPGLLDEVDDPEGKNPIDDWKAKRDHLREVYSYLLDRPEEWGIQPNEDYSLLVDDSPIVEWMRDHFPNTYHTLIDHAAYIQRYVALYPYSQIRRWVSVPYMSIASLAKRAITETSEQRSAQRLIAAYLWYTFAAQKDEEQASYQSKEITPPHDVSDSAGMSLTTFNKYNFEFDVEIESNSNPISSESFSQVWIIHWNPDLLLNEVSDHELASYNSRTTMEVPEVDDREILRQISLHNLYHPVKAYQTVLQELPMVLSDGITLDIPLIPGIVPALMTYLIPVDALYSWFQMAGVPKPTKRLGTLYNSAIEPFNYIIDNVDYIHPRSLQACLPARDYLAHYLVHQDIIMQRGIPVDTHVLQETPISIPPYLSPEAQAERYSGLLRLKHQIYWATKHHNGYYRGISSLHSASERTYYKRFNIQSFPKQFRNAVQEDEDVSFVHADVVSNDLTMVFILSEDPTGLSDLKAGKDPYMKLANNAFPNLDNSQIARQKVKGFMSPWIYGAGPERNMRDNGFTRSEYDAILNGLTETYPDVVEWFNKLHSVIQQRSVIPPQFNLIDNAPIPIPPVFARQVAPSLLIQRLGANYMKLVVNYYMNEATGPERQTGGLVILTVHDSILLKVHKAMANPENVLHELLRCFENARDYLGLPCLNVRAAIGSHWGAAEMNAKQRNPFHIG